MTFGRFLLGVVVGFALPSLASAAKVATLSGKVLEGDLVSISKEKLVLNVDGKETTVSVENVLKIDLNPIGSPTRGTKYHDVELTDGTIVHAKSFSVKGNDAIFEALLTSQKITLPVKVLSNYLGDAGNPSFRSDWNDRVKTKRTRDIVAALRDGVVNELKGTLGKGDDKGEKITFRLTSGTEVPVGIDRIHGFIWQNNPDPNAPAIEFRLHDTHGNIVMGADVTTDAGGVVVTTPAGAKLNYKFDQIGRFDYSKGKLTFLSDMTPIRKEFREIEGEGKRFLHFTKDRSLSGTGSENNIKIGGEEFKKGIEAFAYTDLEYDLGGDYEEFRAVIGFDDNVGSTPGVVKVIIEADGKPIVELELDRTKTGEGAVPKAHNITRNIKDVRRLRIVVTDSEGVGTALLQLGKHVAFGNAQVRKAPDEN